MVFGIIAATLFLLEIVILLVCKVKRIILSKKLITALSIISFLITIITGIHLITVIDLWSQRPILMYITGFIMFGAIILISILCIKRSEVNFSWLKWIVIPVFVLLCIHVYSGISAMNSYKDIIRQIEVKNLDITRIPNGIYEGEYDAGYIYAHVNVTVNSGRIIEITLLEHRHEKGKAAENIIEDIIARQELEVDAISSATNSSNVIKKAVENALLSYK